MHIVELVHYLNDPDICSVGVCTWLCVTTGILFSKSSSLLFGGSGGGVFVCKGVLLKLDEISKVLP